MVKIYCPINETWIIPAETLQEIKEHPIPGYISKFHRAFSSFYSMLRMGYHPGLEAAYYLEFFMIAPRTTADICISIKNTDFKIYFKNISNRSDSFDLPSDMLDPDNVIADGSFEIEINGMFIVERNEYPTIQSMFHLTDHELWKSKEKDFDIIVIDRNNNEEKIQIHKEMLMAQSLVFKKMFQSEMEETKTNTLKIIDFHHRIVKLAVQYFYGHGIPSSTSSEDIFELYRFADKYFTDNLMDCTTKFISYRLTPSNVFEISNHANASNYIKLQKMCNDFITAFEASKADGIYMVYDDGY